MKFLNPSIKLPQPLYLLLLPISLLVFPKEKLEKLAGKYRIIIVSARPSWSKILTEKWLRFHGIPFDKLYCLGFGKGTKERKLEVIKKEKIEIFIEDNKRTREFLKRNSIKTISSLKLLSADKSLFIGK